MKPLLALAFLLGAARLGAAQETPASAISIQAEQVRHRVSPLLTGACLEDVNHEVYGGIDSQMIFGESFAEPAPTLPLQNFTAYGGRWSLAHGILEAAPGDGPKLVREGLSFSEGEVSVELYFPEKKPGNAGLLLNVTNPGYGADRFTGYEIALETDGHLILGRHRQNWEPLRQFPCRVPAQEWIKLTVRRQAQTLTVLVNDERIATYEDLEHPLAAGTLGLRTWQREARFRNLTLISSGQPQSLPFACEPSEAWSDGVSGMWRATRSGTAQGACQLVAPGAFSGPQSQQLTFASGSGAVGIENQGLNRWGLHLRQGESYDGFLCVRAERSTELWVALESRDGQKVYAQRRLRVAGPAWQKLSFTLKPKQKDSAGRFAIRLHQPGTVTVGYAFLQPGPWGRFKNLPVRRDVAEGLLQQSVTVLRLGGCMANAPEYRWKKMIGPREQRPPYRGWWYPYSSNGWGILDFLNFCEAASILGIPDFNMGETPQDMADFVEYVNGPVNSAWGRRRAADGHPAPYRLQHLQLGNEEQVNEDYWAKFKPLAEAIWAKDPHIILVVGDFAYGKKITDPFHVEGAAGQITTLAAQQKILQLAKQHQREVWFDVHIGTEGPSPDFGGTLSYVDALEQLADGAKHRVVIFEFNAGNHSQRRALANAAAIQVIARDGRIPIACSANCLQPDGQNDNAWDQGLLFLNPGQVWLQPPGYVTQIYARQYQPLLVASEQTGAAAALDVAAQRSDDGRILVLQVVNATDAPIPVDLRLRGLRPQQAWAHITELTGPLDAVNTAEQPQSITPVKKFWSHHLPGGESRYVFPAFSTTSMRLE